MVVTDQYFRGDFETALIENRMQVEKRKIEPVWEPSMKFQENY